MLQDGLTKVVSGETTFEEILRLIDLDDDLGIESTIRLQESLEVADTSDKHEITNSLEQTDNNINIDQIETL